MKTALHRFTKNVAKLRFPKITARNVPLVLALVIGLIVITSEYTLRSYYKDRISQKVYLINSDVSGLQRNSFYTLLQNQSSGYKKLEIKIGSQSFTINLDEIDYEIDYENSWREVQLLNKPYLKNPFNLAIFSPNTPAYFYPAVKYNETALNETLTNMVTLSLKEPVYEKIILENGEVGFSKGQNGHTVNKNEFSQSVLSALRSFSPTIQVTPTPVESSIPSDIKNSLLITAKGLVGKKILFTLDEKEFVLADEKLINSLNDVEGRDTKFTSDIVEEIANYFKIEPKDSVFIFEEGRVSEFVPSQVGISVDPIELKTVLIKNRDMLAGLSETSITLETPHSETAPNITTESVNNLGIKEKIGSGISYFRGSITSRIHNIALASSRFNGVLVAPNEIFSFNKVLGDVSKFTGFQQAYIIRDGQTVLGDGGGVCQVSTTLFRAVLDTGLPVVERRSHSYRVGYYEQGSPPGLDATVFDPTTDFKFKNDTGNYILIQTTINNSDKSLVFDLYGTSDGRIATTTKPVVSESSPPPEDLYIDDPTLALGVVKQIDYKAYGAKIYFNYKVERGGAVIYEKTFYSNYQPWQAKFLRGTGV